MNTIYFIMGKSGSGKDSIAREILKQSKMERLLPCTTRPMRKGESEGNPYHFIKDSKAEDNIIARTVYHRTDGSYYYGFEKKELNKNCDYLIVANPAQVEELSKEYNKDFEIAVIEIITDEEERIIHVIEREAETDKNYEEVCRRIKTDKKDFSEENCDYKTAMKNADKIYKLYNNYEMKPDEIAKEFLMEIGYRRNEESITQTLKSPGL